MLNYKGHIPYEFNIRRDFQLFPFWNSVTSYGMPGNAFEIFLPFFSFYIDTIDKPKANRPLVRVHLYFKFAR